MTVQIVGPTRTLRMLLADHLSEVEITMGNVALVTLCLLIGAVPILVGWIWRLDAVAIGSPGPGRMATAFGLGATATLVLWLWGDRRAFHGLWFWLDEPGPEVAMGNLTLIGTSILIGTVFTLAAWVVRLHDAATRNPGPGLLATTLGVALGAGLVFRLWDNRRGFHDLWHYVV